MENILGLIGEQMDKVHQSWDGGFKYGPDYNILQAIVEYRGDDALVARLVASLKDRFLANKVKKWILGE